MKTVVQFIFATIISISAFAQSPIGKWKKIAHRFVFEGKPMDSQEALLKIRPCAAKIVWEINADGSFRLNAAESGCDESYKNIQERLWAKSKWKLEGNRFTISATNFAVGQTYTITFSGNTMTMTGTEGQGVIVYQRL